MGLITRGDNKGRWKNLDGTISDGPPPVIHTAPAATRLAEVEGAAVVSSKGAGTLAAQAHNYIKGAKLRMLRSHESKR